MKKNDYINKEKLFTQKISQLDGRNDKRKDYILKKKLYY